jgi:hypothetical protein
MVEIAIFWFQIHITNGLNSLHWKWRTGNQYRVTAAENRMRSNLELLPVMNVKKWLKIAVCSSTLNIYICLYHGIDNIIKQSFISSSSCPKKYFLWNWDVEYRIIQHWTGCTVYRRGQVPVLAKKRRKIWFWVPLFSPSFEKVWISPRSTLKKVIERKKERKKERSDEW